MPLYSYKTTNPKGEIVTDTVQAQTQQEAVTILKSEGMQILSLKEIKGGGGGIFTGRVSIAEKSAFCRFMSVMLRAGLSVPESVDIIREETKSKRMQKVLADIASQTRKGKTMSSVLSQYKDVFDPVFLTMVKAGEESGTLEQSFQYLSQQLSESNELSQKIKSSLMYPAVIFVAMMGVGLLMMLFVLPKLAEVFTKMKVPLPTYTKLVFSMGLFFGDNVGLILGLIVAMFVGAGLLFYFPVTRSKIIGMITRLPVAKNIVEHIDVARFSNTLGTLLKSGVPILESLNVSAETLSRPKARAEAKGFSESIAKGESLSDVLMRAKHIFPPTVIQTVRAGEKTGSLEEVLSELSKFYEREVDHALKRFTSLLEPALMLVVGVAVGVMVVMMIAPIYSIVGGLQQSIQK